MTQTLAILIRTEDTSPEIVFKLLFSQTGNYEFTLRFSTGMDGAAGSVLVTLDSPDQPEGPMSFTA